MTILTDFQRKMADLHPETELRFNEPLSKHTSFRIGGPAEVMAFPKNRRELAELLHKSDLSDGIPVILGAGTNVLAPDAGLKGLVICLKDCMGGMEQLSGNRIRVAAGVTMTRAAVFAAGLSLGGMEFAHGIPGTVGGGVFMNAGAYGGQISDICESVDVMSMDGCVSTFSCEEMAFSYRHSRIEDHPGIVLSAVFKLTQKPQSEIRAMMQDLMARRKKSQPLELPSAGSAFKRPVGNYAGALIEQAGLKGFCVGNAGVSEKHAGFVVNLGGATAEDVKSVLQQVSQIVFEQSGVRLEPEVRIL